MKKHYSTSDKEIQEYLELTAPLENYYIFQVYENKNSSVISYINKNGIAFSVMDDNDERVEICIDFLKRHGAPVFKTIEEENAYIEEFNRNTSHTLQSILIP